MESDFQSAKRAGWDFIYAGWGYGKISNINYSKICDSPAILYEYLKSISFD